MPMNANDDLHDFIELAEAINKFNDKYDLNHTKRCLTEIVLGIECTKGDDNAST